MFQVVVPEVFRVDVLETAHNQLAHIFWPHTMMISYKKTWLLI